MHVAMRALPHVVAACAALVSVTASAQSWPAKAVRVIVPFAPGGGADLTARPVGQKLSESLGQPFIVDNRGGAAGGIAADFVAKSATDGHTLLINNEQMVATPTLSAKPMYDPVKDFVSVGLIGRQPTVVAVNTGVPANSVKDLVELVRAQSGKYSFASCGQGTPVHIAGEMLKLAAKIDLVHVPYRGCGPAMVDTVSGQVPLIFTTLGNALPFEKTGKIRILGVASLQRVPANPALPTIVEAGFPGFESATWFGVFAPTGTPMDIVNKLNGELTASVNSQGEKLRSMQFIPATASAEGFAEIVRRDFARWQRVVREAKIEPE
jgi:tripartite-type tricarboxylate transporter receptor subunit TctC